MTVVSLGIVQAQPVRAGKSEAAAVAIIGGILGAAIISNNNKKKREAARQEEAARAQQQQQQQRRAQAAPRRPRISQAQLQQNRQTQDALNYFGYNAGTVDGLIGKNSRAAMRRYETAMEFPVNGELNVAERNFLLESQQRAVASANQPPYDAILASQGRAGLLQRYRDELLGIPAPEIQNAAIPEPPRADTAEPSNAAPELPVFNVAKRARSASQLCNEVNILTMANGGMSTSGAITDADFALNEQFCLARAHAESESNGIISTITDLSEDGVKAQCDGLASFMAPMMPALENSSPAKIRKQFGNFVEASGKTKGQLITGGRVCLGVGYRVDDQEIVLASAAVLIASGLPAYGEIFAHHLREGLGMSGKSPAQGEMWLQDTLAGLANGDVPVLGQTPDRVAVLSEALTGEVAKVASGIPEFGVPDSN
ncbi:MAG: peptidoglycan-binding domain-containing protein [Paracoccaceae bacterium]